MRVGVSNAIIAHISLLCVIAAVHSVFLRSPSWREDFWCSIRSNQIQLGHWSDSCPENFMPMWLIVEAELARVQFMHQHIAEQQQAESVRNTPTPSSAASALPSWPLGAPSSAGSNASSSHLIKHFGSDDAGNLSSTGSTSISDSPGHPSSASSTVAQDAPMTSPTAHPKPPPAINVKPKESSVARIAELFRSAVSSCAPSRGNSYTHLHALVNEMAARFWMGLGVHSQANPYLIQAMRAYTRWGANRKRQLLLKEFPGLSRIKLHGRDARSNNNAQEFAGPSAHGGISSLAHMHLTRRANSKHITPTVDLRSPTGAGGAGRKLGLGISSHAKQSERSAALEASLGLAHHARGPSYERGDGETSPSALLDLSAMPSGPTGLDSLARSQPLILAADGSEDESTETGSNSNSNVTPVLPGFGTPGSGSDAYVGSAGRDRSEVNDDETLSHYNSITASSQQVSFAPDETVHPNETQDWTSMGHSTMAGVTQAGRSYFSSNSSDMDLRTVVKATQAISSEIVLSKLLHTLMNILIRNAGAEQGILLSRETAINHQRRSEQALEQAGLATILEDPSRTAKSKVDRAKRIQQRKDDREAGYSSSSDDEDEPDLDRRSGTDTGTSSGSSSDEGRSTKPRKRTPSSLGAGESNQYQDEDDDPGAWMVEASAAVDGAEVKVSFTKAPSSSMHGAATNTAEDRPGSGNGDTPADGVVARSPQPLLTLAQSRSLYPASILNFVSHTRKSVILSDAYNDRRFGRDPYIVSRKTKSLLCMPLIHRDKLVSVIFLENNMSPATFSSERLVVCRLLTQQAAISIDNARLYAQQALTNQTLELNVQQRTRQLQEAMKEANEANKAKSSFLTKSVSCPANPLTRGSRARLRPLFFFALCSPSVRCLLLCL